MNIRRIFRLGCLSVASFFWAGCGSDTDSSTGADFGINPGSSSADILPNSSEPAESSSSVEPSSSDVVNSSSSEIASASSDDRLKLSRDTSVTCSVKHSLGSECLSSGPSEPSYSCMELQDFLKKDTTVSQKILDKWEKKLLSCGAVMEMQTVYGIIYTACQHAPVSRLDCSDGKIYQYYGSDNGIAYITEEEYYETHSSSSAVESSSSAAESSSSSALSEDLVTNCPQDSFALFAEVLADVQKELYEKVVSALDENETLSETKKVYLNSIIDRENKTMNGNLYPYGQVGYNYDVENMSVYTAQHWFSGYVARTRTCADGAPETTPLYREKYDAILQECLDLIHAKLEEIRPEE